MILQKRKKLVITGRNNKKVAWERWMHDYLVALRERHNLSHKEKLVKISIIDVVLIKGGKKNRAK